MKKLSLLLRLLFICFVAKPQNNSNLDLNKVREQYITGHQQGNPELVQNALQRCQELIVDFKKSNDQKNLAKTYTLFGQILVENGKFAESKEPLIKALDLSKKEFGADADETIEAKKYLSWAYGYLGDSDKELKYSLEILDTYKNNEGKYTLEIADLYNTIGMNYGARNNRAKECKYLKDAQQMLENYKTKNEEEKVQVQALLMNVLNSLSLSYIGSFDFMNALQSARRSLQIGEKIAPNNPERAATMSVIGRCIYALDRNSDSAIYYLDNALNLLEKNNLISSPMWLSYRSYKVNILARDGKAFEAKAEAKSTIESLTRAGTSPDEALNQLLILSQNDNSQSEFGFALMESNFREMEQEFSQKQTKERYIYGGIFLALFLILGIAFGIYRNRQTQNEIQFQKVRLEKSLLENSVLRLQINPHFLSNTMVSIQDFLNSNNLEDAEKYLVKFSKLMKSMLENSRKDEILLSQELKILEWYMQIESLRFNNPFKYQYVIAANIDPENIYVPPMILQPIIENSIKYGLKHKPSDGLITITINKNNEVLHFMVEDNGVGRKNSIANISESDNITNPHGLNIIINRIKLIDIENRISEKLKITDLFIDGKPSGTLVELYLPIIL